MAESTEQHLGKERPSSNYWEEVHQNIQRYGDKTFFVTEKGSMTFAEADRHANVICQAIQATLTARQVGVGIFIRDHLRVIPAMIGILKSGNYIIPLDITFPAETLQKMFSNAGIRLILTVDEFIPQVNSLVSDGVKVLALDGLVYTQVLPDIVVDYSPADIVQILFTSGSTGQPKGAIEDYRYLLHAIQKRSTKYNFGPGERYLQLSTFTYSAPHINVFAALRNGMTLCYYNLKESGIAGLPGWVRDHRITIYNSTPAVYRNLINLLSPDDFFPTVKLVMIGGEKRLHSDIVSVKEHFSSDARIGGGFVTTETQTVTTAMHTPDELLQYNVLPSGRPLEDIRVFIWDENGNPLPPGEEGEIVVYGDALARGYINNPELTRQRFLPDPANPPWQYFKTGDLGRFTPDGQLVHLGRLDNMVKIKGVRIELEGIERHVLSYPGIVQVASKVFEDEKGNRRLTTYYVPEPGIQVPVSDLRKHLAMSLPRQMLPHYLVCLDKMPLTPNGKIALSQLPPPLLVRPDISNDYIPPADDLEQKLLAIWEQEIGIHGIGVTDDFFDVGGDSLIGVLLFAAIEASFGRNLPVSVLLTASTIRKQADLLRSADASTDFSPLIPIRTSGKNPPLFFIPGKGGYPTRIRHLAKKLDPQTPVYALQDLMDTPSGSSVRSLETAAAFYLSEISKVAPDGPQVLVGESMGGKVAYEMAQQLRKEGKAVPLLVLLDTYNMNDGQRYGKDSLLAYDWMLIKKHLTILVRSDWRGRLDYLRFYWETGGKKIRHFLSRRSRKVRRTQAASALPQDVRSREQANLRADSKYQVKPYPGRVILCKALRGLKTEDPTNGWDHVTLGELIVHPMDCYHGSILFEPAVSQLASLLNKYIADFMNDNPEKKTS